MSSEQQINKSHDRKSLWGRLTVVWFCTFFSLLLASGLTQVVDPFVRHDDFPALLLLPEMYYSKTLSEGRWLNYWWHFRPFATPAWANYLVYQAGSALFASAIALHSIDPKHLSFQNFLAILIAFSPQSADIAVWFNTLLPGIWIVALYSVISLFLQPQRSLMLLFVFVPLSLLAYSTYPFLLLAVCLARRDSIKTLKAFFLIIFTFALAMALGMALSYGFNYVEHEIFGVVLADWRSPTPASTLSGYLGNLHNVKDLFEKLSIQFGDDNQIIRQFVFIFFLTCAGILLLRETPLTLYLLGGVFTGVGLLIVHTLLKGSWIPFRATQFVWVFLSIITVRAVFISGGFSARISSLLRITLLSGILIYGMSVGAFYQKFEEWQKTTRELAAKIPTDVSKIYFYGSILRWPGISAAGIQHEKGFRLRVVYLTNADIIMCDETPRSCTDIEPPFNNMPNFGNSEIKIVDTTAYIRLPPFEYGP